MRFSIGIFCLLLPVSALAQNPTPKDVRLVAKDGQSAIPKLALYLNSPALDTRIEVVKQLTELGGKDSLDPLIQATHDADPEMQMRAIDGLVNFYLPGYVKSGPAASLARVGSSIKAKFSDSNDQVIDGFVTVRP
ncbi:MAG TPA: HEAT repeat domain-containing protein, partial [Bryobacteraceae bacterium]|nr:HEAT repeat domain-containing protein [Bryobacteraceae bacterium]